MPQQTDRPRLFLVDGSNYLYRAYYAIRELSNSKGFPTNAIYGFTTMLLRLLRDCRPEYIAIVFDLKGPTFRHEAYAAYKATRKATPDTLIPQIPYIKQIVRALSIPVLEKQGIEADDLIGTLAIRHASRKMQIVIVSGDKDLMQLVSEDIIVMDTMKEKTYDAAAVRERFGVDPEKVVEILGIMGDASDNIPGVPGIGAKGAQHLIEEYGSIEEVIRNVDRIKNAKAKNAIREFADQARLSRQLALIRTDEPIELDLESCRPGELDTETLMALFREFEFSSLIQDLKIKEEALEGSYRTVNRADDFEGLVARLQQAPELSMEMILSSPEPMRAQIIGLSMSLPDGEACYIPLGHDYPGLLDQMNIDDVLGKLAIILQNADICKYAHDLKALLIVLARHGIRMQDSSLDTMVAAYVLNPSRHSFDLADLAIEHLGLRLPAIRDLVGSGARAVPLTGVPVEKMQDYACRRIDMVSKLIPQLAARIEAEGFSRLFHEVEMPLIFVLAAMEKKGVLLDTALLKAMSEETGELLAISEGKIHRLAGERFNINSPKQLQIILFEKLGLPRGRKTKEGYSTDVDVLSSLARSHELPAEILAFRSMAKLKSTYIDALPLLVNPETGRIHTSYNQTATATGRLSSSNPNLQNIPIRTLEGKRIRQSFIVPPGHLLVSADYSQIELRVLAHLSGDDALIDAFASGEDIHSRTASDIFGVFPEMVNTEMRRQAKVINFGILYGMSAFGLSRELGLNQKMAQAYIDGYFQKYRGVKAYLDEILEKARQTGYVSTLLNRRRYLPELSAGNASVRQFAERMAVNTPIQGTAADLIKLAMISITRRIDEQRLSSVMIMQVHDELVFEVPEAEKEEVMSLVKREMEGVIALRVPLKVDIFVGRNWDEAHG